MTVKKQIADLIAHRLADLAGGGLLLAFGASAGIISSRYPLGSFSNMGPGFVPLCVSVIIATLGALMIASAIISSDARQPVPSSDPDDLPERTDWRPLLCVLGSIVAFGLLVSTAGLLPATFAAVIISMLSETQIRPLRIVIYACVTAIMGYLVFILGLRLPINPFWWN